MARWHCNTHRVQCEFTDIIGALAIKLWSWSCKSSLRDASNRVTIHQLQGMCACVHAFHTVVLINTAYRFFPLEKIPCASYKCNLSEAGLEVLDCNSFKGTSLASLRLILQILLLSCNLLCLCKSIKFAADPASPTDAPQATDPILFTQIRAVTISCYWKHVVEFGSIGPFPGLP